MKGQDQIPTHLRIPIWWRKGRPEMVWKEYGTRKSGSCYWGKLPRKPVIHLLRIANAPTLGSRWHRVLHTPCLKSLIRKDDTIEFQTKKLQLRIIEEIKRRKKQLKTARKSKPDRRLNCALQVLRAPKVPLLEFKALFNASVIEERWKKLKADGSLFQNGKVRPDLCPVLREELRPAIAMIEEIKAELGF